jgi:hypothetical protein
LTDTTKKNFPFVFGFKNLLSAQDHVTCTACLLQVRRAILDLDWMLFSRGLQGSTDDKLRNQRQALIKTTGDCADGLCMSIPFLCKPENGMYSLICSVGPLHLAKSWYKSKEAGKKVQGKLAWCEEVDTWIQNNGVRTLR